MQLVKYDAACRALAEARTVDEIREIGNRAEAMRAYARQAQNRQLEIDACEIRVRAERRLGEVIIEAKKTSTICAPGGGRQREAGALTLKDIGLSPSVSVRAQNLAVIPADKFEDGVSGWRASARRSEARLSLPFPDQRNPYARGDRQRAKNRRGAAKATISLSDRLDGFHAADGRKVAFWRAGELDRLAAQARLQIAMIEAIKENMPVANPSPLDLLGDLFDRERLADILESVCGAVRVPKGCGPVRELDRGLAAQSEKSKERKCLACEKMFTPAHPSSAQLKSGKWGMFCSRSCAGHGQAKP